MQPATMMVPSLKVLDAQRASSSSLPLRYIQPMRGILGQFFRERDMPFLSPTIISQKTNLRDGAFRLQEEISLMVE